MKLSKYLILIAVLLGGIAASGETDAAGAVYLRKAGRTPLSSGGGQAHAIKLVSASVPTGTWLISAQATIIAGASAEEYTCGVFGNSTQIHKAHADQYGYDDVSISLATAVYLSTTVTIALYCWHLNGSGTPIYADDVSLVVSTAPGTIR